METIKYSMQGSSSSHGSFSSQPFVPQGSSSTFSSPFVQQTNQVITPQYTQEQVDYMNRSKKNVIEEKRVQVPQVTNLKYSLQGSSHPCNDIRSPTNVHNPKLYNQKKNRVEKAVHSIQKSHMLEHLLHHVPGGEVIVGGMETGEILFDKHKSTKEKTAEIGGIGVKTVVGLVPIHAGKVIGMAAGKAVEETIKKVV